MKNTDLSGKARFLNLKEGNSYIYSVLKGKEYINYGLIKIMGKENVVNITIPVDSAIINSISNSKRWYSEIHRTYKRNQLFPPYRD